jgi:hypothetical protein
LYDVDDCMVVTSVMLDEPQEASTIVRRTRTLSRCRSYREDDVHPDERRREVQRVPAGPGVACSSDGLDPQDAGRAVSVLVGLAAAANRRVSIKWCRVAVGRKLLVVVLRRRSRRHPGERVREAEEWVSVQRKKLRKGNYFVGLPPFSDRCQIAVRNKKGSDERYRGGVGRAGPHAERAERRLQGAVRCR